MNAQDTWNNLKPVRKERNGAKMITQRDIATAMFIAVPISTILGEVFHVVGWEMHHEIAGAMGTLVGFYLARVFRY